MKTAKNPTKKSTRKYYFLEWRKHRQMTQEQAAERAGLSQETISRIERGDSDFSQESLEALSYAYTCEPGELLNHPPPKGPSKQELTDYLAAMEPEHRFTAFKVIKALSQPDGNLGIDNDSDGHDTVP